MNDEHEPETAQEAFARVEGELSLLRRAVERMAAERAELPEPHDYSETLAGMVQKIDATLQHTDVLAAAAQDGSSPRHVVDRIVAAGVRTRAEDRRTIATAAAELKDATRVLQEVAASARRSDEQNRWLMWTAIGGVVFGMVLWAAFAGAVACAVPASWQWPGEDGGADARRDEVGRRAPAGSRELSQHLERDGSGHDHGPSQPGDALAMPAGCEQGWRAVRCTVRIKPTTD